MDNSAVYQAILSRKSTRKYLPNVEAHFLAEVQNICGTPVGLVA